MEDEKNIFCKMCGRVTRHFNLINKMWKCYVCGEYNKPDNDREYDQRQKTKGL